MGWEQNSCGATRCEDYRSLTPWNLSGARLEGLFGVPCTFRIVQWCSIGNGKQNSGWFGSGHCRNTSEFQVGLQTVVPGDSWGCSRFGKVRSPPFHHRVPPTHAAWCPSFNRLLVRPTRSDKGKLTLRSNSPFSRSTEIRASPSGTPRMGFGSKTVSTVPSSPRCMVIADEQQGQSQKYSTRLDLDKPSAGSLSKRKSLPSSR
jgi:hypothetical protein